MQIVILSGGLGTRLRSEVKDVPKVMAPINTRPFLEYLLDFYITQDIRSIVLLVAYKQNTIIQHFKNSYKNIHILYHKEEKPLGTGGAIVSYLKETIIHEQYLCITNGDTFLNISLQKLQDFHKSNDMDITIALVPMHNVDRYGSVQIKNNRVISFQEKKFMKSGLINAGTYIINKNIFWNFKLKHSFSFEKFLQENVDKLKIGAFIVQNSYFIDIGIPSDYKKAQIDFKELF